MTCFSVILCLGQSGRSGIKINKFPRIKVDFIIEENNLDLEKLTKAINIFPTETRNIDDWPKTIKNSPEIPEELQPRYVWCISQEENLCRQVEIPINRIIVQIKGKEREIYEFCKKNNLKKSLCITVHAETMYLPEMVLSPFTISYFGKLETEIGFDIYTY